MMGNTTLTKSGYSSGSSSSSSSSDDEFNYEDYNIEEDPWQQQLSDLVGGDDSFTDPYESQKSDLANQLIEAAGTDYTQQLNELATQDINEQYQQFKESLNSLGMSELALRSDVQSDWADAYSKAAQESALTAYDMQQSALQNAVSSLATMSSQDLEYTLGEVNSMLGGSSSWQNYQQMLISLMENMGMGDSTNDNSESEYDWESLMNSLIEIGG